MLPDEREAGVGDVCGFVGEMAVGISFWRGKLMRAGEGWGRLYSGIGRER